MTEDVINDGRMDKVGDWDVYNREKLDPVTTPVIKQFETIRFSKTSKENNIVMQFFEDSRSSKLTKLDIIDAGVFEDPDAKPGKEQKHIYYVGKIYMDDFNTPTFINIFTMVLD